MTNRAAQTAYGPMTIVVIEQRQPAERRIVDDDLAAKLLPAGLRFVMWLTKWPPLERALVKATEGTAIGIWGSMLCRKRAIDDVTRDALRRGCTRVVILGAGLDTRAYRLPELADVPVIELDLPENSAFKRQRIEAVLGAVPRHVTLTAIDFDRADLEGVAGVLSPEKTLFVWEAVTQYLREEGVRRTLRALSRAAPGSRLVFTYLRKDFLDGDNFYGAEVAYKRFKLQEKVWRFALAPEAVSPLLAEFGWRLREDLGAAEFHARILGPIGRDLAVSEIERVALAEKV
jgi:methyltransferase (TIGR00027 family)